MKTFVSTEHMPALSSTRFLTSDVSHGRRFHFLFVSVRTLCLKIQPFSDLTLLILARPPSPRESMHHIVALNLHCIRPFFLSHPLQVSANGLAFKVVQQRLVPEHQRL